MTQPVNCDTCFAKREDRCGALKDTKCSTAKERSFYKTPAQYKADQDRASERILTFSPDYLKHLQEKYGLRLPAKEVAV